MFRRKVCFGHRAHGFGLMPRIYHTSMHTYTFYVHTYQLQMFPIQAGAWELNKNKETSINLSSMLFFSCYFCCPGSRHPHTVEASKSQLCVYIYDCEAFKNRPKTPQTTALQENDGLHQPTDDAHRSASR